MDPALAHLAVDVVLGPQCPHREAVETLVAKRPNTTLHGPQPSLAGLIARGDLAIGAGGATTWERACLGLPSVVLPIALNQLETTKALALQGSVYMPKPNSNFISDCFPANDLLLLMSIKAFEVADGCGVGRVVAKFHFTNSLK